MTHDRATGLDAPSTSTGLALRRSGPCRRTPAHTELCDGYFVFRLFPQRLWHSLVVQSLTTALAAQAPASVEVDRQVTVRLDKWTRFEPDIIATKVPHARDRTAFEPADVALVVEVTSPESGHRDRTVKLRKYAEASIKHYWLIEEEDGQPVVHVHELDTPTRTYVPAVVFRGSLERPVPFPVGIDLTTLFNPKNR
ncbi:Uma2 family endonuclease [Kutzneria sp. NPDC052558]|uniref:Uma2 family endonuclease n=1 Tax=Kutzneria sp. NPDC052558 TaxID=3364121 RepID=UPI0037C59AF8